MKKVVHLVVPIIAFGLSILMFSNNAFAEGISWTTVSPTVIHSEPTITNAIHNDCSGTIQAKEIFGTFENKNVCVTTGEGIKFGNYFSNREYSYVIGISYDSKMYKLNSPCSDLKDCMYLQGSDTLVTKQYLINGLVRSLVVYKNFMSRLSLEIKGLDVHYNFDSSNPDYIFKSSPSAGYPNGYAWPIGGIGASDNGKWLAVEFRERGYGLLNIETLEMKRISINKFNYGQGLDPGTEIAVGGDGKYVAVMGYNAGMSVFDIKDTCGDVANDTNMSNISPIAIPCVTSLMVNFDDIIPRFKYAVLPRFNDDGGQLVFYAFSYSNPTREVVLHASGYTGKKLDYLAMGDSYQSGEGETKDRYYFDGTNNIYEKCHVSSRSYPFVLAGMLNLNLENVRSVACSGAEMKDIYGNTGTYLGQGGRFDGNNMKLNTSNRVIAQSQAKLSFIQGRIHQNSFVEKYQPKIITIGIGGNDAGFIKKLQACIGPDTCIWAGTEQGRAKTVEEIKNQFSKLVQTYSEIHKASPGSKIYVIGYPKIIDRDGYCGVLLNELLDKNEMQFINEGIKYLNEVISAAARAAGVKYVDIYNAYGESSLCGNNSTKAMNGIRSGDDNALNESIKWFKPIGQESFHPTPYGHELNAETIISSVGNIMDYNYCGFNLTICPDNSIKVPEPSNYWNYGTNYYPPTRISDFIIERADITGTHLTLRLLKNSLAVNSNVRIVVTSTPVELGNFTVAGDGSLDVDIDLPADLEDGYHTLHIYGNTYSGEPIQLYQIFEYKKYVAQPTQETINKETVNNDNAEVIKESEMPLITENKDYTYYDWLANPITENSDILGKNSSVDKTKTAAIKNTGNIKGVIIYILIIVFSTVLVAVARLIIRNRDRKPK